MIWRGLRWGHQAGDSDGWVFCGCLAGDLLSEWIQKSLLFVEAQFRDIRWSCRLCAKCQAPAVPGCEKCVQPAAS